MRYGLTIALMLSLLSSVVASPSNVSHWDFDVYLNDKKVGRHEFRVSDIDGVRQVQSEASFKYKLFLITAYRYEHSAEERWAENCLVKFDAKTNANGERFKVSGKRTATGFSIETDGAPVEIPGCVMTFAYWNPEFLDQPRLLNSQTGQFVDVSVLDKGTETLDVRGEAVPANRFELTAEAVDLTLWYSPDGEWLALESVAKGGHIIRYELS